MDHGVSRRTFLKAASAAGLVLAGGAGLPAAAEPREFHISLAAWSLHRMIGTKPGQTNMLEMPRISREEFGIDAIELVNTMMASSETSYLDQLLKNAEQHKVKITLIMIDGAGSVGTESEDGRKKAVEQHKKWIDVASHLGCMTLRMNWAGYNDSTMKTSAALNAYIERSAPPLRQLCEYADKNKLNLIIENHGGPSSHPDALIGLIKKVDHPRFGTLPDFGNFPDDVDRYDAIDRMMPYAKAVSAKCYDFNETTGDETTLDFPRLIANVVDKHGYHGNLGIEYEGDRMSEFDGVKACKKLLERLHG
jgi:sugar phosphate isomerase/epimerase